MSTLLEAFLWACGGAVYAGLILALARCMSINRLR